jgi:hypothetical protein
VADEGRNPEGRNDAELRRQLATLVHSQMSATSPADAAAAVGWWNLLARLGLPLPLVVVHDLGLVLSGGRSPSRSEVSREALPGGGVLARYQALLGRFVETDSIEELGTTSMGDETLAVILARIAGETYLRWHGRSRLADVGPLATTGPAFDATPAELARVHDPAWALPFIQRVCEQERTLLARLQQIELSAVRLFGLFPLDGAAADLVDLFHVVGTAGAADVVDFTLQLLPSLLETKRRPGAQRFSIDGFASVERRGNVDALLPSELAHDDDAFTLKALTDDLLYFGHERQNEVSRPLHYILVDGSASMRGAREVFARGLALALAKKLSLVGGSNADIWVRFFDSRLHPRIDLGRSARRDLPRLLSFRSQRGRNYARVFADLSVEVGRLVRDEGRDVAITFITHGNCQIPTSIVKTLAAQARLFGIFVLPSGPLELEYLPLLHKSQVVSADSLGRVAEKRRRALEIVEEAASG